MCNRERERERLRPEFDHLTFTLSNSGGCKANLLCGFSGELFRHQETGVPRSAAVASVATLGVQYGGYAVFCSDGIREVFVQSFSNSHHLCKLTTAEKVGAKIRN